MIKLYKNLTKREVLYAIICILLIVVQVWLELTIPDYMSEITQLVQTEGSKMADILREGTYMVGCALASLVCSIIVGYFAARVASSFSATIKKKYLIK